MLSNAKYVLLALLGLASCSYTDCRSVASDTRIGGNQGNAATAEFLLVADESGAKYNHRDRNDQGRTNRYTEKPRYMYLRRDKTHNSRLLADDDGCYTARTTQTVTCGTEFGSCSQLYSGGCKSGYFETKSIKQSCSGPVTATTCYYDKVCCPFGASIKDADDKESDAGGGGGKRKGTRTKVSSSEGTAELAAKSVIIVFMAFGLLYAIVKVVDGGTSAVGVDREEDRDAEARVENASDKNLSQDIADNN